MTRFPTWAAASIGLLLATACGGSDGAPGSKGTNGQPCSVKQNTDGTATITCPDGTKVDVKGGANGEGGPPGDPGTSGEAGPPGPQGDAGTSCTIVDNKDGTKTITCTDGTTVTVNSNLVDFGNLSDTQLMALDMTLTITSVDFTQNNPVVQLKITDQKGNPVKGLDSMTSGAGVNWRFGLLKLVPGGTTGVNGAASDTWVSYNAATATCPASSESAASTATAPSDGGTTDAGAGDGGTPPPCPSAPTGALVDNGDGTYTYTFGKNVKDSANAGTTYEADKVHRVVALAYKSGNPFRPMNAWKDLVPQTGNDVSGQNDKVNGDSCMECHSEWRAQVNKTGAFHSGQRYDVHVCPVCHNDQRRFSSSTGAVVAEPTLSAGTTAGTVKWTGTANVLNGEAQLNLPVFVHKIHMGEELGVVPDRANGSGQYPGIQFDETTYPQDIRHCQKCHNTVPKADNWKDIPGRRTCGACHDATSFVDPAPFGRTLHGGGAQPDDTGCAMCHGAGKLYAVDAKHIPVADPNQITTGTVPYSADGITTVSGWQWDNTAGAAKSCTVASPCTCSISTPCLVSSNTNGAYLAATGYVPAGAAIITYDISSVKLDSSKHPQIVFKLKKDGTDVNFGTYDATNKPELLTGFVGSPSVYFAWSVPQDGIAAPADFNASSSAYIKGVWNGSNTNATLTGPDATTGYYTLTITNVVIPSTAKMLTGGVGYTYSMSTTQPLTQTDLPKYPYVAATKIGGLVVPVSNVTKVASGFTARRAIVDTARCNKCHDGLGVTPTFHAGQRNDGPTCSFCHTVNRVNSGWAVNAKDFVHALHGASKRTVDFTWHGEIKAWEVTYPGVLNNCEQCHLPNTYDLSASASKNALPNMLYSYAATGTYSNTPTAPATLPPYLSPYITAGQAYGSGYTTSGTRTVGTQWPGTGAPVACTTAAPCTCTLAAPCNAEDTTLVHSPIAAACVACHDTAVARNHMLDNGASFYTPRGQALAKPEECMLCHGPGKVAAIADVHK